MGDENYTEEEAEPDQPRVDREPDSAPIPANPNPSPPETTETTEVTETRVETDYDPERHVEEHRVPDPNVVEETVTTTTTDPTEGSSNE